MRFDDISRREVLKLGGAAAVGLAIGPAVFLRTARAEGDEERRPILVHVFQRGGMDGLNAVVPHADKEYYSLRKTIAIPRPAKGREGTAVDLDGRFGLHPALASLSGDFKAKRLAIVHAVGSKDPTRSHFDAQDYMETGTPGVKGTEDGWITRYIDANGREGEQTFRCIALTSTLPRVMRGARKALAIANFNSFTVGGGDLLGDAFGRMYGSGGGDVVRDSGREAFDAVKRLKRMNPSRFQPENGAKYPNGGFGQQMLSIARLIKAGVGLEVAFAQSGGWDTHLNQGGVTGGLANRLRELGDGIHAFSQDLGDRMRDVVVVTLTEFGRTAKENGTRGTDHGHASASFVLGGEVKGGRVYGRWPGLREGSLYQKRDLDVTTDFRDILTEVLSSHMQAKGIDRILPDHKPRKLSLLG